MPVRGRSSRLDLAASPAVPINVTGPEKISIRSLALEVRRRFGIEAEDHRTEADRVWLNDASKSFKHWGHPTVSLEQMIDWTAAWVSQRRGNPGQADPL